ncbi:serine hydrolase [Acidisphaera sp. S103]|uniref:serine hydrolase domain-containing protein n=1 Tax=Acidisphaera sp. S103 TaxID=1747223 RepID=UPI00131E2628|nr:serine hydrolase [Acidisphaera sp. S103]
MSGSLRHILVVALLCVVFPGRHAKAEDRFPGAEWAHVSPAQAGWSEEGLAQARDWSRKINSTAVMVIHHGVVVAEWGDTAKRTELASVRKSILSALIGIAVAQKKINLDSTLAQLGIDDNPPSLTEVEKQATVRMLLEARSGVYHDALYETETMQFRRPARGSHAPGTFWYYNNWDFNALGTIYEHATGIGIYDALDQQIAQPIGMQDYRPRDGKYFTGTASIHRAYPIWMSARDLARFALLYLHEGRWAGRQVVPAEWVRDSIQAYSRSEPGTGYGYLWRVALADPTPGSVRLPAGSFLARGNGGQYAFVIPAHDLVVVNRVDRKPGLPSPPMAMVVSMLDMILKAGGFRPE